MANLLNIQSEEHIAAMIRVREFASSQFLVMATKNGVVTLGEADERGTIEAGKKADLQMIKGDPLKSFDSLGSPEIVFIDGKIHRF